VIKSMGAEDSSGEKPFASLSPVRLTYKFPHEAFSQPDENHRAVSNT